MAVHVRRLRARSFGAVVTRWRPSASRSVRRLHAFPTRSVMRPVHEVDPNYRRIRNEEASSDRGTRYNSQPGAMVGADAARSPHGDGADAWYRFGPMTPSPRESPERVSSVRFGLVEPIRDDSRSRTGYARCGGAGGRTPRKRNVLEQVVGDRGRLVSSPESRERWRSWVVARWWRRGCRGCTTSAACSVQPTRSDGVVSSAWGQAPVPLPVERAWISSYELQPKVFGMGRESMGVARRWRAVCLITARVMAVRVPHACRRSGTRRRVQRAERESAGLVRQVPERVDRDLNGGPLRPQVERSLSEHAVQAFQRRRFTPQCASPERAWKVARRQPLTEWPHSRRNSSGGGDDAEASSSLSIRDLIGGRTRAVRVAGSGVQARFGARPDVNDRQRRELAGRSGRGRVARYSRRSGRRRCTTSDEGTAFRWRALCCHRLPVAAGAEAGDAHEELSRLAKTRREQVRGVVGELHSGRNATMGSAPRQARSAVNLCRRVELPATGTSRRWCHHASAAQV